MSLAAVALLAAGVASATRLGMRPCVGNVFRPVSPARAASPLANEFDAWWAQRRAVGNDAEVLDCDRDSVVVVLDEFVRSDYARLLLDQCNLPPSDFNSIGGMFEVVKLERNAKLVVKLTDLGLRSLTPR